MAKLLAGDVPWVYIRQAQQLLRLNDKYGANRVEAACARALAFDLMNVRRVEGIILQTLERVPSTTPTTGSIRPIQPSLFAREPSYFNHSSTHQTIPKEDDHGHHH